MVQGSDNVTIFFPLGHRRSLRSQRFERVGRGPGRPGSVRAPGSGRGPGQSRGQDPGAEGRARTQRAAGGARAKRNAGELSFFKTSENLKYLPYFLVPSPTITDIGNGKNATELFFNFFFTYLSSKFYNFSEVKKVF